MYVCGGVCVCEINVLGRSSGDMVDVLELELQAVGSYLIGGLGMELKSLVRQYMLLTSESSLQPSITFDWMPSPGKTYILFLKQGLVNTRLASNSHTPAFSFFPFLSAASRVLGLQVQALQGKLCCSRPLLRPPSICVPVPAAHVACWPHLESAGSVPGG